MKRTLRWRGPALRSVDAGFLHGDILALAVGRRLHLFSLDGSTAHAAGEHELPFDINLICVSNDGRWLLARTLGERLWVWDREHAAAIHVPLQDTTRPPVVEGFTRTTTHGDLLIAIRRPNYLDGFSLAEQRWTISLACETFKCKALVPMASGQHVLTVGAFAGESKGSLAMVDISHDSESVFTQFRKKRGIVDYAYELCAGPCGADGFVAFRDHDGEEGDDADDRENFEQIWGLRGAYVRRVDGTVTQTIELERWWKGLAPAAGGPRTLAVAGEDMIHLVDRATERVASVSARWLAASPDGAHVLVEQDGELAILDL